MPALRALSAKEVVRVLLRAGFYIHHQKGSHTQLRHHTKTHLRVTVPFHARFDLPTPIVRSILRQAEVSVVEFKKLLE
jgi:predicted RNA binding protein YcfA (HicA-like mRNA interferase family)